MLARTVENWLISASELSYQRAFAQLLAAEGYRVLHGPVHHPYEHGKDITALDPAGLVCAYQLKGGDIDLKELESIQGQLLALAGTAVTYPGVEPPRVPDRAFLVTNGRLSAPARDRLRSFNDAGRARGATPIEVVEQEQLVSRFVDAQQAYLPTELRDLNALLRLVLAEGDEPFPVRKYAAAVWAMVQPAGRDAIRAISSAAIVTSYASAPWERKANYVGVAEAWLVLLFCTLRKAETDDLEDDVWRPTFELALSNVRQALRALIVEAAEADDLVIPDVVDGLVYPVRAAVTCGYAGAYFLAELGTSAAEEVREQVRSLLVREYQYMSVPGEAGAALVMMVANALEALREPVLAARLVFDWVKGLASANQPDGKSAVADPYHTLDDLLMYQNGGESSVADEEFAGTAYTLHVGIEWLARRGARELIALVWPIVTRLHFAEFQPEHPHGLLAHDDPGGLQHSWAPDAPASWAVMVERANALHEAKLPQRLWRNLEVLPYLPLLYPYRLTADVGKALDYLAFKRCRITLLEDEEVGEPAGQIDPDGAGEGGLGRDPG